MRRRKFITLLGGAAAWPLAAMAQQAGRTYRLGCLLASAPNDYVAFFDGLRRRGFIEGQNLTVEYRAYGQHVDLISQYAAELVKARLDVIGVAGEEGIRALQQATKTIPIVAIGGDLLASGFVNSLSRPDGNTTGVSFFSFEADGKPAKLAVILAGESPANRGGPVAVVVISSNGKGDRPVESLEVKAPGGLNIGLIRTGGRATWQAVANVRTK